MPKRVATLSEGPSAAVTVAAAVYSAGSSRVQSAIGAERLVPPPLRVPFTTSDSNTTSCDEPAAMDGAGSVAVPTTSPPGALRVTLTETPSAAMVPWFATVTATRATAIERSGATLGVETWRPQRATRTGGVVVRWTWRKMPLPEYQRDVFSRVLSRTASTLRPAVRCGVRS